jgi:hypothetical protein
VLFAAAVSVAMIITSCLVFLHGTLVPLQRIASQSDIAYLPKL